MTKILSYLAGTKLYFAIFYYKEILILLHIKIEVKNKSNYNLN